MQYLTAESARGACHSRVFTVLDTEVGRVMMFTMTHVKTDHFSIGQHIEIHRDQKYETVFISLTDVR